ncbi:hypothetical protein EU805_12945 [Salipiger sp. IMCC34102]|uniref:hypothetical protein n=1 Tax=Salipiger sp. IMCC34102 TaxID=2510647 RepID=UPI00101DC368|nr:hypothetical protein [Salipiger sp. IMCC34102]RYH01564.1 hypothetical protein EU805_12945 [Salipiger sp. IMCC34102]
MTPRQAAELARIAQVAFQADRARMAKVQRAEQRLRAQLDEIKAQERQARDRAAQAPDAMALAGGDRLWHQWIEGRRTTIQTELAQLLARKADLQSELRASFGRKAAAEALEARAVTLVQKDRDRRNTWSD